MSVKFSLIASLAAVLIICVTAELPTEENDVLDSKVELDFVNSAIELDGNMAEMKDIRQKREADRKDKKDKKPKNKKGKNKEKKKGKRNDKAQNEKKKENKKKSRKSQKGRKKKGRKLNKKKDRKFKKEKKSEKKKNGNRNSIKKGKKSKKKGSGKRTSVKKEKKSKKNGNRKKTKKDGKRKGKKPKGKSTKTKTGNRPRQAKATATVNLTCLRDAVTYTKFLKDNVVNFLRRATRLEAQNNLTSKKAGKKGEFKEPAARLIQSGGGDKTNLSCGGSTTSVGAQKMLNVTNTLDTCAVSIKNACKPQKGNETFLKKCNTNAKAFKVTVEGCVKTATEGKDACSCFQAAAVASEKKVLESCKGTDTAKAAAKARTKCLKVLSACKTAATTAGTLQYACQYTAADLLGTLKQLSANSAAFTKFLAKIKSLTGLSGVVPGTTSNRTSRAVRKAEEDDAEEDVFDSHQARTRGKREEVACSTIITSITTCTTAITNTPALTTVVTKCSAPTYTVATCTDADKTAIQSALNSALEANGITISFTASIKSELKETTGSTPSQAAINGSGGTAKANARSRSMLRKMIMEKMQLRN